MTEEDDDDRAGGGGGGAMTEWRGTMTVEGNDDRGRER